MRLIPLLILTLTACGLPDDNTHNREGPSGGSSNAGRDDEGARNLPGQERDRSRDAGVSDASRRDSGASSGERSRDAGLSDASRRDSGAGSNEHDDDVGRWWQRDGSLDDQGPGGEVGGDGPGDSGPADVDLAGDIPSDAAVTEAGALDGSDGGSSSDSGSNDDDDDGGFDE